MYLGARHALKSWHGGLLLGSALPPSHRICSGEWERRGGGGGAAPSNVRVSLGVNKRGMVCRKGVPGRLGLALRELLLGSTLHLSHRIREKWGGRGGPNYRSDEIEEMGVPVRQALGQIPAWTTSAWQHPAAVSLHLGWVHGAELLWPHRCQPQPANRPWSSPAPPLLYRSADLTAGTKCT